MCARFFLPLLFFLPALLHAQLNKPRPAERQGDVFRFTVPDIRPQNDTLRAVPPPPPGRQHSAMGYAHTPRGVLHMLFLYVGFTDDNTQSPAWRTDTLPDYAISDPSLLVSRNPVHTSSRINLTDWYSAMSGGKFTVTGEVFWVRIRREPFRTGANDFNFHLMYAEAIRALQEKYPNEDWSRFDRRQNVPAWEYDNSTQNADRTPAKGDGVIDYAVINFRNLSGPLWTGGSEAFMYSGNSIAGAGGRTWRFGAGHSAHFMGHDPEHHNDYFRHEFAHVLFNAPHYMGANNLCGKYFYTNKGWGIMGETHKMWNTANAWETWWLGWKEPRTVTLNGTYLLKDFLSAGDAIRIRIPSTNQYLWLENHAMTDSFDRKLFYRDESPMRRGIYAFITARGNNRDEPEAFHVGMNINTNSMKVISAKGNHDYAWKDTVPYSRFDKVRENPLSGQTDMTLIRLNFKPDHIINVNTHWNNEAYGPRSEQGGVLNDAGRINFAWSGSAADGFREGDEIGLSGIVPALNYRVYDEARAKLDPLLLNGLSIRIRSCDSLTSTYALDIRFDDVTLRTSKRWCGNIVLGNTVPGPATDLRIAEATTLLLDRSGTPDTHLKGKDGCEFPDFIRPTEFTLRDSAVMELGREAQVIVADSSTFTIERGSAVRLGAQSALIVRSASRLECPASFPFTFAEKARLVLSDDNASLYRRNGKMYAKINGRERQLNGPIATAIRNLHLKSLLLK